MNDRSRVVPVFGIPTAGYAVIMEEAGAQVGFIGTSLTLGNYTALADDGVITMTESIAAARYIANAVKMPLILDGDTGHGGAAAVRRLVEESIDAGLAGVRIDDQPLETKRRTQSDGIEIVDRDGALRRYGAAVARRDELDPDFVIMAQCYARDAVNGGLDVAMDRLVAYGAEAGVDWVQLESPHDVAEIVQAREAVGGVLSAMRGRLPQVLTLEEHAELGLDMAWYTFFPQRLLKSACWEAMRDFGARGVEAWTDYCATHVDNPFARTTQGEELPVDLLG